MPKIRGIRFFQKPWLACRILWHRNWRKRAAMLRKSSIELFGIRSVRRLSCYWHYGETAIIRCGAISLTISALGNAEIVLYTLPGHFKVAGCRQGEGLERSHALPHLWTDRQLYAAMNKRHPEVGLFACGERWWECGLHTEDAPDLSKPANCSDLAQVIGEALEDMAELV